MRIIGVSPYHDSSVAVVKDNKLEYFFKEERLSRIKRDSYPMKSLMRVRELVQGKVDLVILTTPTNDEGAKRVHPNTGKILCKMFDANVLDVSDYHHETHASLAFYNSGFNEALVFVIDRNGSYDSNQSMRESETVFHASYPGDFKTLYKNAYAIDNHAYTSPNCDYIHCRSAGSIVKVYETATSLLDLHPLENGKTMGLSAYGEKSNFPDYFVDGFVLDQYFCHENSEDSPENRYENRELKKYKTNNITLDNYKLYADYAYHVQHQTQNELLRLIEKFVDQTNIKNVCITGGYGLNVVANSYVKEKLPEVNFYFEPLADDTGNSIGAALLECRRRTGDSNIYPLKNTFFQGEIYDTSSINGRITDIEEIVDLLVNNKSVALFQGLAEAGPRALGNRSILFNSTNPNAKDIVNNIKKREWYRPFAGMILEEHINDYFESHRPISKYMTEVLTVRKSKWELIRGIVHVDGSCRLQPVSKEDGLIYEILNKFYKKTGVPILLNTSFNLAGEPLVEKPEDAINTLNNSSLNYVWFADDNKLVENNVDIQR